MLNKVYKIAVVGLRMGKEHIEGFLTHPQSKVQAICDVNPQVLKKVGNEFGIKSRYTSFEEMINQEELDIVSIATPNSFHHDMAILSMEKGNAHVFCEKPIGLNYRETVDIQKASEKTGKRVMVNFCYRFKPEAIVAKYQIEENLLGEIYSVTYRWLRDSNGIPSIGGWFSNQKISGGGAMIDIGVHILDNVLWLLNFPKPLSVSSLKHDRIGKQIASQNSVNFNVEDTMDAFIIFENNLSLSLQVGWAANIKESNIIDIRILGTKGSIHNWNRNEGYDFDMKTLLASKGISLNVNTHQIHATLLHSPMFQFVDAINKNIPHPCDVSEACNSAMIIDAIYWASSQNGNTIKLYERKMI